MSTSSSMVDQRVFGTRSIYFSKRTWGDLQKAIRNSNEYNFTLVDLFKDSPSWAGFDTDLAGILQTDFLHLKIGHAAGRFRIFLNETDIRSLDSDTYPIKLVGKELRLQLTNAQRRIVLSKSFESQKVVEV